MKILIYSTPTCTFCTMAKNYLESIKVPFETFDVAVDIEKRKEMINKSGQLGVPVIDMDGQIIIGFDKATIDAKLKEAGLLGVEVKN